MLPTVSKSSVSRSKSRLTKDGIFCKILSGGKTFPIPLHPHYLMGWMAAETYTELTVLKNKFGAIIDELGSAWQENFGHFFQKECHFTVNDWPSYVTYGHLLGWLFSCNSRIQKVMLATPHLELLKDSGTGRIILYLSEHKGIEFEFFTPLSSVDEEIKDILRKSSIKIWTFNPDNRSIVTNPYTTFGVMINEEERPHLSFSFETLKLLERESHVGWVHIQCDHTRDTLKALESLHTLTERNTL